MSSTYSLRSGLFSTAHLTGCFLILGLLFSASIARASGGGDYTFGYVSANGPIFAVAPTPTGQIWIGGYFNSVNGSAHSSESFATSSDQVYCIAVLNTNGTLNTDFTFNTFYSGLNSIISSEWIYSYVRSISVDPNQNTVYVALANRDNQPVIMRFDPVAGQPGRWTFNSTFTANTAHRMTSLWAIAVGDSYVYAAAQLYDNSTQPPFGAMLGRFDLDGDLDTGFAPLQERFPSSPVYQIHYRAPEAFVDTNGIGFNAPSLLLAAGSFGVAAFSGDDLGTTYTSDFANFSDVGMRDRITAYNCPNSGGELIGGGSLVPYMGSSGSINYAGNLGMTLHRYDGSGGMDISTSTNSPADRGSGIARIAALPDGDVLLCGEFTSIHGQSVNNLCHLLPDGTVDPNFANYLDFYPFDMAQQTDGKFVIGGIGLYTAPVFGGVYGTVERLDTFPTSGITINSQPTSQTAYEGDSLTFSASATGWPTLTSQWQKNGSNLPNQTGQQLTLSQVSNTDAATYNVVFQNGGLCPATVPSSGATLTVLPAPPAPANDMFSNAVALTGSSVIGAGTIRSATLESGETDELGYFAGRSVWWTWTAPFTGDATIDLSGCDFQAAAGVFTGTNVSNLTVVTNNYDYGNNCECAGLLTTFSFNVQAGTTYCIAVGGTPNVGTLGTAAVRIAEAHIVWDQSSSGVTDSLYASVTQNNQTVIVGGNATILNSSDGIHWNKATAPSGTSWLYSVAYGNGVYAAVGYFGDVITSTDGVNWTSQNSGLQSYDTLNGICFAQNQFVAVGDYASIITSPDGTNWTTQSAASIEGENLFSVTASQNQYVAVGDSGTIATSPDGVNWTLQPANAGFYPFYSVTYGGGNFLAVGYRANAYISPDGTNWTQAVTGASTHTNFWGATYGNGRFVIVGDNGTIFLSANGTNWTTDISGVTDGLLSATYYNNGRFLVAGNNGRILLTKSPQVTAPRLSSDKIQFSFVGLNGSTVIIESTATLSPPNWQPVSTNNVVNGGADLQLPIGGSALFYRARVQ